MDQGITSAQMKEMADSNVQLVIPAPLISPDNPEMVASVLTLADFISLLKERQRQAFG